MQTAMGNANRNALMAVVHQPDSLVERALQVKLKHLGLKIHLEAGYGRMQNVHLTSISAGQVNVYFKVKGDDKGNSLLFMAVSAAQIHPRASQTDSALTAHAQAFMTSFVSQLQVKK